MFLRPFGSKRLRESYVFNMLICSCVPSVASAYASPMSFMLICYYVFKKILCLAAKLQKEKNTCKLLRHDFPSQRITTT